jgi:hypothetical protein
MHEFFPPGVVTGQHFCDRRAERKELAARLSSGAHTWLMAPRRYGKTSLIRQTLLDLEQANQPLAFANLDLLLAHDPESFHEKMMEGIGGLSAQLPSAKNVMKAAAQFFARLHPQLTITPDGPSFTFTVREPKFQQVVDALLGLEALAANQGKRAVLVLDEFQVVGSLPNHVALEAGVRHAVERSRHVTYVLSGSNRHLLEQLFEDSERPLYHLCERLTLPPIPAGEMGPFVQTHSRRRWKTELESGTLEAVLRLTDCHPYYLNLLCRRLWRGDQPPGPKHAEDAWDQYVEEQQHTFASIALSLTPPQRGLLKSLAEHPTAHPLGKAFQRRIRLGTSATQKALQTLTRKDLIHRDANKVVRVLDPALGYYLTTR